MCSPHCSNANKASIVNAVPLVGLPTDADIVCGRGRGIWTHPGNLKFKDLIERNLDAYSQAVQRKEKSIIINHVLDSMLLTGARFVKKEHNVWYAIDEKEAREKTAHAMRDFVKRRRKPEDHQENKLKKRKRDQQSDRANSDKCNPAASMKRSYSDPSANFSKLNIFDLGIPSSAEHNMVTFPTMTRSKSFSDMNKSLDLEPTPISESASIATNQADEHTSTPLLDIGSVDLFQNLFEGTSAPEENLDTNHSTLGRPSENFNAPDFC